MTIRAGYLALAASCALALGGCGGGHAAGTPQGGAAGLDDQILAWRTDLMKTTPACAKAPADKACESFEVGCKGRLPVSPDEAARGVTDKVVVAMTYNGWDPKGEEFKAGSAFARFDRTKAGWTRSETAPVNLSTCAAA